MGILPTIGNVSTSRFRMLISPEVGVTFFNFSNRTQEGDAREGSTFKASRFPLAALIPSAPGRGSNSSQRTDPQETTIIHRSRRSRSID
jgi:hypothetical protein